MAAGLSQRQISSRVRYRLQAIAREYGGEYVPATDSAPAGAMGVTGDGLAWRASYGVSRASNGETFGIPVYVVRSGDMERAFSGLQGSLGAALDTVRAERDGLLVFVVAYGGTTGAELTVTKDSVTRELGRARWAQQQTGNVANLWVARLDEPSKVTILREFGYTDSVGHSAMHAFMEEHGLDIFQAQRTLETDPALAVLDARAPAPELSRGPGNSM